MTFLFDIFVATQIQTFDKNIQNLVMFEVEFIRISAKVHKPTVGVH